MADGLREIVRQLEQQREAIERALAALREVDGGQPASAGVASTPRRGRPAKAKRKGGMTPDGRRRLSESLKRRWAVKRAAATANAATTKKATGKRATKKTA